MILKKGQGALEYLLLIAGGVLIGIFVLGLLMGVGQSQKKGISTSAASQEEVQAQTQLAIKCGNNLATDKITLTNTTVVYEQCDFVNGVGIQNPDNNPCTGATPTFISCDKITCKATCGA